MMSWSEWREVLGPGSLILVFTYLMGSALVVAIRLRPRTWDQKIVRALDRILQLESQSLCAHDDPLDFRPAETVRAGAGGLYWWTFPGRVHVMRTVRAALADGYRIKLRARARGARGRIIDRTVEFDVRRAA